MNKLFIIIYLMAFTASAQSLTSGEYTITISGVTTEKFTRESFGSKYTVVDYKGNYTVQKNGVKIASQKFSAMKMQRTVSINIQEGENFGNTATYYYETKKFDCMGEEKEAKKYKDTDDIILNGILFYSELRFKDK